MSRIRLTSHHRCRSLAKPSGLVLNVLVQGNRSISVIRLHLFEKICRFHARPMRDTTRMLRTSSLCFLVLTLVACGAENSGGEELLPGSGGNTATGGETSNPGSGGDGNGGSGGANSGGTGGDSATDSCDGLGAILSEAQFNAFFPNRNDAYTYQGMLDAVEGAGDLIGFPQFAREGDCETRKQEVAAFLANVARETGRLVYIEQIDKSFAYCQESASYGCPAGTHEYFGRGPIQLSWNYNYRAASLALFGDDRLLQDPDLVAETPAIAWATGFWFWMIGGAGGDGSNAPHSAIVNGEGFGSTISIINGGEECNGGTQGYAEEAVSQRVCYYEKYTAALETTVGPDNLDCGTTVNKSHCNGI